MNDDSKQAGTTAPEAATLGLAALQRRRLLLRGVGKGGAVLAAAVPLSGVAAPMLKTATINGQAHLCSVSGMQSVIHSSAPRLDTCSGKSAAYWAEPNQTWPRVIARGAVVTRQTPFNRAFGGSDTQTFGEILTSGSVTPQQIWVRALLNAGASYPSTFPYSTEEVVTFYGEIDPVKKAAAQKFFRDWV